MLKQLWRWCRSLWALAPAAPRPPPPLAIEDAMPVAVPPAATLPVGCTGTVGLQCPGAVGVPGPAMPPAVPPPEPGPEPSPAATAAAARAKQRRDTTYLHLRRDLASMAVYLLERFEHLAKHRAEYAGEDVRLLGDLWGCDFLVLDRELGARMAGADKWSAIDVAGNEVELAEIMWPIDYAVAHPMTESDGLQLYRIYTVQAKDVRGKVTRVARKMVRYVLGTFYDDGQWQVVHGYAGLIGKQWVLLHAGADSMDLETKHSRTAWVGHIMTSALTARYQWHVAFGTVAGGPRVLFPTNPGAALQLFRNRDKVPGKERRDQLKHWVEQHWRDNKEDLAFVCHHLRGHTAFNWSGMGCELFVSAFDLEKNEYFKQQAKQWRAQRQHNRVRVHLKKRYDDNEIRPN